MNGLNVLITIEKYWKEWADPRLLVLVLNNGDLNMVTWEQRVLAGDPKFEASQELPDFPYATYAQMLGLGGIKVDRPQFIADAWDQALAADKPTVVEFLVDPEVPPLPPHISFEQAVAFWKSIYKGGRSQQVADDPAELQGAGGQLSAGRTQIGSNAAAASD
jgi:pyruvate dehydrogenase (quinone)